MFIYHTNTLEVFLDPPATRKTFVIKVHTTSYKFIQVHTSGAGNEVPAFKYVLRAVLANSPNSIPPERVFSILNDTFDDDQQSALADYKELSLQLQFNERSRKKEVAGT